jgi:energy-coupling factor transporter ATP-binding protein EcfA2
MLKTVRFQGIETLVDVEIGLEPFTVLVGKNGCGKSTVLDQIDFVCRCTVPTDHGSTAFGWPGELIQRAGMAAVRRPGSTEMLWLGRSDEHAFTVKIPGDPSTWWERTEVHGHGPRDAVTFIAGNSASLPTIDAKHAALRDQFSWRTQRMRLVPSMIAEPVDVRVRSLLPSGYGLAGVLLALAANDQPAYAAIQQDLRAIVPQFERLKLENEDVEVVGASGAPQTTGGQRVGFVMKGARQIRATQVSDGTLIALALLTATHDRSQPDIVLMDDIDHGLHLGAQVQLIAAIRAVQKVRPNLQVICTTHSPFLLHDVHPEEVRVMAVDGEGRTFVKPLTAHPEIDRWQGSMTAGELWANLGEDWVLASG